MEAKIHPDEMREMGAKLANFRKKLALAIDQKKITQAQFGAMFGGYSMRKINSYETGTSPLPGPLLYLIWRSGNSIDDIFDENPINEVGADIAADLYENLGKEDDPLPGGSAAQRLTMKGVREVSGRSLHGVITSLGHGSNSEDSPKFDTGGESKGKTGNIKSDPPRRISRSPRRRQR